MPSQKPQPLHTYPGPFPLWWVRQRMVRRIFPRLCSVMSPLCDRFPNAINYFTLLIPVYPYNSLHQTTLAAIPTRNLLEKRFRLHLDKAFPPFPFVPLRFEDKHVFPSLCLPYSQTQPLFKAEIFSYSKCLLSWFVLVQVDKREGSLCSPGRAVPGVQRTARGA